jgi:hypothetical protein
MLPGLMLTTGVFSQGTSASDTAQTSFPLTETMISGASFFLKIENMVSFASNVKNSPVRRGFIVQRPAE